MKNKTIRIGSRGSDLAIWQSEWVRNQLTSRFPKLSVEIIRITTSGDQMLNSPLSSIGGKGLFTREIENALLDGSVDLAVHSLKDLPTVLPEGLHIAAITQREDVRDVFIPHPANRNTTLDAQSSDATIATGSLRRKSQLHCSYPGMSVVDLRGNLNTRFRKLDESSWAGMILAAAGVRRLGMEQRIGEYLAPDRFLPAVGQGALAVEIRSDDKELVPLVTTLHHEETFAATTAERSLLKELEGGCQVPIGAFAHVKKGTILSIQAIVASLDGTIVVKGSCEGKVSDPIDVGKRLASDLVSKGADRILEQIRDAGVVGR